MTKAPSPIRRDTSDTFGFRPIPRVSARSAIRAAAALLTIAMIAVVIRAFRRDGPGALQAWRASHIQWTWLCASIIAPFVGHAIYVYGWRRLLRDADVHASYWHLARIFLVSNLGRYLPAGKAWQMAIVGMMAAESDLPPALLAASSLFQGIIGVGVGLLVLFATAGSVLDIHTIWFVLAIVGVVVLLFLPRLVRAIPRAHELIVHRVPGFDSVTAATMWTLVWTTAASWIFWGVALDALARALLPTVTASVSAFIAAWTASFLTGLLAVVAPAGLGAREEAMRAVLLAARMSAADVLIIAVVARVWATVIDVIPAALVLLIRRRSTMRNL